MCGLKAASAFILRCLGTRSTWGAGYKNDVSARRICGGSAVDIGLCPRIFACNRLLTRSYGYLGRLTQVVCACTHAFTWSLAVAWSSGSRDSGCRPKCTIVRTRTHAGLPFLTCPSSHKIQFLCLFNLILGTFGGLTCLLGSDTSRKNRTRVERFGHSRLTSPLVTKPLPQIVFWIPNEPLFCEYLPPNEP